MGIFLLLLHDPIEGAHNNRLTSGFSTRGAFQVSCISVVALKADALGYMLCHRCVEVNHFFFLVVDFFLDFFLKPSVA